MKGNETTVDDCWIIDLPRVIRPEGSITFVDGGSHVPFDLQRVYYLYDIPGDQFRGGHAHRRLQQLFVSCVGAFDVVLDDGTNRRTVTLKRSYYGLYVPAGIWRELENFSSGSVCLVLASLPYDETEYIRDRADFVRLKPTL